MVEIGIHCPQWSLQDDFGVMDGGRVTFRPSSNNTEIVCPGTIAAIPLQLDCSNVSL